MGRFETAQDLDPEAASSLLQFGLALADTKLQLGRSVSHWATGAPVLEATAASAAITQEELGHARALHGIVRELPGAPREISSTTNLKRIKFYAPARMNEKWESWYDVVAGLALIDEALNVAIESAAGSEFDPLREPVAKMMDEEQFHRAFTRGWMSQLARKGERSRARLQQSVNRMMAVADQWFGPDDEPVVKKLVEAGILSRSSQQMRSKWMERITPLLEQFDLKVPPARSDWTGWKAESRELSP